MGFLTAVREFFPKRIKIDPDLRKVAKKVDELSHAHDKNKNRSPDEVASKFFRKRFKEFKDAQKEIKLIKVVRGKFKITRTDARKKLILKKGALQETSRQLEIAQNANLVLQAKEVQFERMETDLEKKEESLGLMIAQRESLYKQINRLISQRQKGSIDYSRLMKKVQILNKEIKEATQKLSVAVQARSRYDSSGRYILTNEIAKLQAQIASMEKKQKQKLQLEEEVMRLQSRIARMNIYIQGTYDYTIQVYHSEANQN